MNDVTLMWNVCRDIEVKTTTSGQSIINFTLATNKRWKDKNWENQEKTSFHNMICWGKQGEIIAQYFHSWSKILIKWEIQYRDWEAEDGNKKYKTEININEFFFIDSNKKKEEKEEKPYVRKELPQDEISIDEIPF